MLRSTALSPVENVCGIGPLQGRLLRGKGVCTVGTLASEYCTRGHDRFKTWMREEVLETRGSRLVIIRVANALGAYCRRRNLLVTSKENDSCDGPRKGEHRSSPRAHSKQARTTKFLGKMRVVVNVSRVLVYPRWSHAKGGSSPRSHSQRRLSQRVHSELGLVHTDVIIRYISEQ